MVTYNSPAALSSSGTEPNRNGQGSWGWKCNRGSGEGRKDTKDLDLLERRTALSGTPVNMFKNTRNMRRTHSEILNRNKAKVYPCTEKDLINR